jgi:hypothetical protein
MPDPRSSSDASALISLLVDVANVRLGVAGLENDADLAVTTTALTRFAGGGGRLGTARAYADWTRDAEGPRALVGTRLEPVMVPATAEGEDRSHIRLAVDAVELAHEGDDPDAFVLVSDDPALVPLVRALRRVGAQVVVVAPGGDAGELGVEADLSVALSDVLAGAELEPVRLRPARAGRGGGRGEKGTSSRREREERRPVALFDAGSGPEPDFTGYDWTGFVQLIGELEERLPFVGVRYLVNKVLAPHNCALADPRLKRDLINEAVDQGIIELYTVDNLQERLDPVTACRLDRHNPTVHDILGATGAADGDGPDDDGYDDADDYDDGPMAEGVGAGPRAQA